MPREIEDKLKQLPEPAIDAENPEWTEADFARAKGPESLSPDVLAAFPKTRRGRGPQRKPTKEQVTLRLSPEVLEHFRSRGSGWQTRIDDALRAFIDHVTNPGPSEVNPYLVNTPDPTRDSRTGELITRKPAERDGTIRSAPSRRR